MATFRSPAVALMPDVTVKPLRSKANAIINLMGTAGGILVLVLGTCPTLAFTTMAANGIGMGLGFTLAIVLFASVRERVDKTDCPPAFKGFPITLIAAGLMALAFMGFSGMKIF